MGGGLKALLKRRGKRLAIAGALEVAGLLSRTGLMRGARGRGAIFTLHHVRPADTPSFAANKHLEVTPEFLDVSIRTLRAEGYEFIPLEKVPARLLSPELRPFAVFTLDDGYRNNAEHALPVFERHGVPFTIFATRGFAERTRSLWWETLGSLLGRLNAARFDFGGGEEELDLSSEALKLRAFERFAGFVATEDEDAAVARIDAFSREHGLDPLKLTADLIMDADELRRIASHPLASLGAHTLSHRATARLPADEAGREMQQSADWLQSLTGNRPPALAYPYGFPAAVSPRDTRIAQELGFTVAVTTQPGTIDETWTDQLTGLPRISLNGHFQHARYVSALASGIPFAFSR
ncbi:polysaccharide deacetylase [Pseudorhizobium endolithicum]|uniref:Chitooligosaccharide deacetylase n=1 Tax=Pseudorhizobium endolithicum TaxID=1191678 RepID=A0ABM8PF00_9HYPH|nr:polysaccharide deacetylase family protein [Pseudorhizobium endolithicum]CAD6422606.1 polysaccharide deacetylase [Rhizobium sp. Q54]CAD7026239.1 polysaccharide deacetylase [Pseudorhizobium endolithicum]